jgi:threonylcarbamoyladenosine tRNA methylthiotransferase MtaB
VLVKKTVAFHTLGCKLNFAETSTIARLMVEKGYEKVKFEEAADVYVINTCSVTDNADKECKDIVKRALSKSPEAFVAIVGCYAQLKPEEIAKIEGVDVVLGATEKFQLLNYITDSKKKTKAEIFSCEIDEANFFVDSFSQGDRTRTFLKVQDGCDYNCSFCTIPLARGRSRSDSISNVVNNAKKIAGMGVKEIVLTGVNTGDFGNGNVSALTPDVNAKKQENFLQLIHELDKVEGIERFRISSIEPNLLKDEIIEFCAGSNKFVPHFHIPLQSGSNKMLGLMRRRYKKELYAERVSKIKALMPNCCIGVDVIVGFPSETEDDFLETYNFLQDLNISYLHVFTYSERDNTDAIHIQPVVPYAERKRRNKMLRILSAKKQRAFYESMIGKTLSALVEHEDRNGFMNALTENYLKVKFPYQAELANQIIQVEIKSIDEEGFAVSHLSEPAISAL